MTKCRRNSPNGLCLHRMATILSHGTTNFLDVRLDACIRKQRFNQDATLATLGGDLFLWPAEDSGVVVAPDGRIQGAGYGVGAVGAGEFFDAVPIRAARRAPVGGRGPPRAGRAVPCWVRFRVIGPPRVAVAGCSNESELAGIGRNQPEWANKPLYMGFQRAPRPRPDD